jgi:hypothetical protein
MFLSTRRLLIGPIPTDPRYDPIMFCIMCSYIGLIIYPRILAIWNEDKEMSPRSLFRTINLLFWLVMLRVILVLGTLKEDYVLLFCTNAALRAYGYVGQTDQRVFRGMGLMKRAVDVFE